MTIFREGRPRQSRVWGGDPSVGLASQTLPLIVGQLDESARYDLPKKSYVIGAQIHKASLFAPHLVLFATLPEHKPFDPMPVFPRSMANAPVFQPHFPKTFIQSINPEEKDQVPGRVWISPPPLPMGVFVSQEGTYGIQITVSGSGQAGIYRVQNNIVGYNVYVHAGSPPDPTSIPTTFSSTLPISVPLTPPVSGTLTYYVLVCTQDHYGLQSVNQNPQFVVTIDSSGGLLLSPIAAPTNLSLYQQIADTINILASYAGYSTDVSPATLWKIWIKVTLPDPTMDTPAIISTVTGDTLSVTSGSFAPGTYYVMVGLYRLADNSLSPTAYAQITLSASPSQPIPVPSGFQQ